MPITVVCDCGKIMAVPDRFSGRSGRCRDCGSAIQIPDMSRRTIEPLAPIAPEPPEQVASDLSTPIPLDGGTDAFVPVARPVAPKPDVDLVVPMMEPIEDPGPDTGCLRMVFGLIAAVSLLVSFTGNMIALLCFMVACIGLVLIPRPFPRKGKPSTSAGELGKAIAWTAGILFVFWLIFYVGSYF